MTEREYRQDDRNEGYCPVCAQPLTGLTVAARGFCEQHGWQWAEWTRIDEGSPHAEPYDVPADPEPQVRT